MDVEPSGSSWSPAATRPSSSSVSTPGGRDLEEGRVRYALLLNEAGYAIDDGTICPLG